jgi:hypothetical protein
MRSGITVGMMFAARREALNPEFAQPYSNSSLRTTMNKKITLLFAASPMLLSACASIVTGANQSLSVQADENGKTVVGANCKLNNGKGAWFVTTPGSVTVHRAYGDLNVRCEKKDVPPGIAVVKSSTKGMAFGNILFGGVIGAAVDAGTGAAYDYPSLITVEMGKSETLPPPSTPDDKKTENTASND